MDEDKIIYVGNKSVMNYVLAVVTQFNEGCNSVKIRARGRAINRAVDVAEVVRNKFVSGSVIKDIHISTEEVENSENQMINLSVIEIFIEKGE